MAECPYVQPIQEANEAEVEGVAYFFHCRVGGALGGRCVADEGRDWTFCYHYWRARADALREFALLVGALLRELSESSLVITSQGCDCHCPFCRAYNQVQAAYAALDLEGPPRTAPDGPVSSQERVRKA